MRRANRHLVAKGRGALSNPGGRFEATRLEAADDVLFNEAPLDQIEARVERLRVQRLHPGVIEDPVPVAEVIAFYEEVLVGLGWTKDEQGSVTMGDMASFTFTKEGVQLSLLVSQDSIERLHEGVECLHWKTVLSRLFPSH